MPLMAPVGTATRSHSFGIRRCAIAARGHARTRGRLSAPARRGLVSPPRPADGRTFAASFHTYLETLLDALPPSQPADRRRPVIPVECLPDLGLDRPALIYPSLAACPALDGLAHPPTVSPTEPLTGPPHLEPAAAVPALALLAEMEHRASGAAPGAMQGCATYKPSLRNFLVFVNEAFSLSLGIPDKSRTTKALPS